MTNHVPNDPAQDDTTLSQREAKNLERKVIFFGSAFFAVLAFGLWLAARHIADGPLPPPSFVPTGDIATQSEIEEIERLNRIARQAKEAHDAKRRRAEQIEKRPLQEEPVPDGRDNPPATVNTPQDSNIEGAPPQPVYRTPDTATILHAHQPYDRPIGAYDPDPKWLTVRGTVTAIVPRTDRMTDGKRRENLYARTEFYDRDSNLNCYFHQYMGQTATLQTGDYVLVQYDPRAVDPCGTSHIVK